MEEEEKNKVVLRVVEEVVREMLEEVATAEVVEVERKKREKCARNNHIYSSNVFIECQADRMIILTGRLDQIEQRV